ncbi:hypothetical protein ACF0H5_009459 [Mactra antiquata]
MSASLAKRKLQVNTGLGTVDDDITKIRGLSPVGGGMNMEMQDVKISRIESSLRNDNDGRMSTSSLIERESSAGSNRSSSRGDVRSSRCPSRNEIFSRGNSGNESSSRGKSGNETSSRGNSGNSRYSRSNSGNHRDSKLSMNSPISTELDVDARHDSDATNQKPIQVVERTPTEVSGSISIAAYTPDDSRLSSDLDLPISDESRDSIQFEGKSPRPTLSIDETNADDLYCVDHMKLCTKEEAATHHLDCEYIVPAYEWVEAQAMEKDRSNTEKLLKKIDSFAGIMIDERNDLKQQLTNSKEDITDDFMDIVEDLIADLLAKQKKFMTQLDELHEGQLKTINDQIKRCKKVQTETSECMQQLDTSIPGSADFKKLKKKIQEKCPVYEEILRRDFNSATRLDYEFQPDPWVNEVFGTLKTIGKVVTVPDASKLPGFLSESKEPDFSKRQLIIESTNDGGSVKDKNSSCFTGCTFVSGSFMILTDWNNNSLKLFNKRGLLVDRLEFKHNPWDVKKLDETHVVVTIPGARKVAIVAYTQQNIEVESTFDTDCECWGITPVKDKLAVTCDPWSKTPSVKLYTRQGRLLAFYQKDGDERPLFSYPEHITTDKDQDVLYVSDSKSNQLVAITVDGLRLFRYRSKSLISPSGVASDCQGFIYVNGKDSQNIHQITKEGKCVKILMDKTYLESPRGLCFEPDGERIIITDSGNTNCEEFLVGKLK